LPDKPGAQQELMADGFGAGGRFAQRGAKMMREFHGDVSL